MIKSLKDSTATMKPLQVSSCGNNRKELFLRRPYGGHLWGVCLNVRIFAAAFTHVWADAVVVGVTTSSDLVFCAPKLGCLTQVMP